jgi:hypothetical protein
MNQRPRWVRLIEKSRGQKSRATVPLNKTNTVLQGEKTGNVPMYAKTRWKMRLKAFGDYFSKTYRVLAIR